MKVMDTAQRRQLASQIRQERKSRGMSQEDLAEASGVSLRAVQNAELGKSTPQEGNLLAMLDVLGMRPNAEQTRQEWPQDVKVFLDVMGAYLSTLPEATRMSKYRELTLLIVGRQ
jgi:transcriptional regulator with XRE-family HTH domain